MLQYKSYNNKLFIGEIIDIPKIIVKYSFFNSLHLQRRQYI
jgi:hypothetical protein